MLNSTKRSLGQTIEWKCLLCYLLLIVAGCISIYSAAHNNELSQSLFDLSTRASKQLLWIGVSLIVGLIILFLIKPHVWEVLSTPFYLMVIGLLIATILFGSTINGSKSWFRLGPVSFQPCEISKISTSLLLAHCLRAQNFKFSKGKDLLTVLLVLGLPMLCILLESETGSMLVYLGFVFVLYREGLSGWWLALLLLIIVLFVTAIRFPVWLSFLILGIVVLGYYLFNIKRARQSLRAQRELRLISILLAVMGSILIFSTDFAFEKVLKPHQRLRIEVLLGMKEDPMGAGYNVNQSLIAIGSGGFSGKGFLQGTQTAYGFVPEQSTDFIFCTIGEEFGFVGCSAIILLFVLFIGRIVTVAEHCREPFTRIYGYCIASCFFMHLIINVGMTIGLMPVIGIPLPFISYGGSSMLSFTIMLFIFLALVKQERQYF